mmetsp:Transcript_16243/g.18026  ORF Transcript_16243/g.18026 Transcript_16243/m.18026 type:complete len:90 (+) Transcript_16243:1215-1484(+)
MKNDRNFLKNANLVKHDSSSPRSPNNEGEDKIQNYVPVFETSNNKRMAENTDDRHQQVIEINGKRYLVIQELDPPNDEDNEENSQEDIL